MTVERILAAGLTVTAVLWTVVLFVAPGALVHGAPAVSTAAAFVYRGASLICHQRPERSFYLSSVQQPVCARCAGLYISGSAGALIAWWRPRRRAAQYRHARLLLVAASLPTVATLVVEVLGLMYPSNAARALAALPLGAAAGWIFVRSLRAEADSIEGSPPR
jgi:uncharacterized membrane protein